MAKKSLLLVFLVFLATFLFVNIPSLMVAKAETDVAVNFELLVNDKNVVLVDKDDIVTVDFIIKRTDSNENYTTNGFQNEIYFDMDAFDFVEGSIVCYDSGMFTAKYQDNIEHGKIIQCANMGRTYSAEFKFCSFQLKAKKDNVNGMVYNSNQKIFDLEHNPITLVEKNLRVMIGIDCEHVSKNVFNYTASTCVNIGYETYSKCLVCDSLFNNNGEHIADIPYLPLAKHSGGTATCISKAVCQVCQSEYGELNSNKHAGEVCVLNKKDATVNEQGYTGDKVCSSCNVVLEKGVVIPVLGNSASNITINIDGNNNILGDNSALNLNSNSGFIILIVILSINTLLLFGILTVLILFYVKNATKKQGEKLDEQKEKIIEDSTPSIYGTNDIEEEMATTSEVEKVSVGNIDADNSEVEEFINADSAEGNDANNFSGIVKKTFETKLEESSENVKKYYLELKNNLLSYKKVKSRISSKYDSIYVGRQQLAKFVIRGKSLYIYLALNPTDFVGTKYNVLENTAKTYSVTPCKYKVNGERKFLWAKELILELAKIYGLVTK